MWDTTAIDRQVHRVHREPEGKISGIPHLAKNERDMGPTLHLLPGEAATNPGQVNKVTASDRSAAWWRRPVISFCPSDRTAPNKSHHPPLVIPSAAEGPAVRPGSRTKVSVPLGLTQTRQ